MDSSTILAGSLLLPLYLYSQDINKLDDVVITATKTKNSVKNLTTSVQIIESEDIENNGFSNLSDILNSTSGIYVSPSGKTFRIRGMEHSDTLILIDGKRVNGEFSKVFELERIPADMIDRVEILKGTSSLLYGSDAMGGVINIITKKSENHISGSIQYVKSEQKNAADFFISNKIDKLSFSLYANYLDRESYTKNKTAKIKIMKSGVETSPSNLSAPPSAMNQLKNSLNDSYIFGNDYMDNLLVKTVGGKLAYDFSDDLDAYFDFSYMEEEKDGRYLSDSYPTAYKAPTGSIMAKYVPAHEYDDNERINLSAGINYNILENMNLKYDIAYSKYEKDRKSYTPLYSQLGYASKDDSIFSVNKSTLKYLINDLQFTHTVNESNRYILGAEYRINDTTSTAFNVDDRTYTSYFAQHEYNILKDLKLIYGARYDKTSIDEDEVSLSFGGVYSFTKNLLFRANYSEGFRSPDDRELYVDQTTPTGKRKVGATVLGDDLKSEKSKNFEVGFIADFDMANLEITAYKTDIDDRISEVSYGSYSTFENISDSEIKGLETALSLYLFENFFIDMNISFTDAQNETDNKDLIEIPKRMAGLVLRYIPTNNFEIKTVTKYVGSQYSDEYEKLGGFTTTNLKVNFKEVVKNTDLFAGVDNIFDKQMDEYLGYIPQSSFYAGIKYRF